MAEQNTARTEEPSDGNNSQDNANDNLVKMLEKAQEKQLDNLTTKLTETLSSSLSKMVVTIFEITKGSGKRMQGNQVGQGSSKKARTYVKRQKEDEPSCSKYVNRFVSDTESSDTEDTSVTRAYAESEQESEDPNDDIVSLPDQEVLDKNVEELLCENKQNKSKKQEKSKDSVLDGICQEFTLREDSGNPLANAKLANILEKFYLEKISEEKTKSLLKKYQKPENCNKMRVPQSNPEIWKINLSSFQRSTDINLQKILLHLMKASYAIVNACDELIVAEETERSNNLLTMLVDSVALLGLSTIELNALRRDLMKHKLPDHLKQLAKDVPSDSTHLFGDDIQKRINQIAATNTALQKSSTYQGSSQRQFSRQSSGYQSRSTRNPTKNYYAPQRSSAQGKKGDYKQSTYRGKRN